MGIKLWGTIQCDCCKNSITHRYIVITRERCGKEFKTNRVNINTSSWNPWKSKEYPPLIDGNVYHGPIL